MGVGKELIAELSLRRRKLEAFSGGSGRTILSFTKAFQNFRRHFIEFHVRENTRFVRIYQISIHVNPGVFFKGFAPLDMDVQVHINPIVIMFGLNGRQDSLNRHGNRLGYKDLV